MREDLNLIATVSCPNCKAIIAAVEEKWMTDEDRLQHKNYHFAGYDLNTSTGPVKVSKCTCGGKRE